MDGAWLVVAAAPPEVNRAVVAAADARRIFVNAVDDVASASAYTGGVLRRGGVTIAVSTEGRAPALAGLLREGLEAVLPDEIESWVSEARRLRERQRLAGVPFRQRRPLLLRGAQPPLAERVGVDVVSGFVSLVGAGPGDPDLLTRRAARVLAEADLVLYDALVAPAALELAPRAQRFPVGKRAGRPSMRQETIHRLMVRAARRGRRVVRLKGGDPFVLGRGRRGSAGPRRGGSPVRGGAGREQRAGRARAGRDPGDAPRPRVRLRRGVGPRGERLPAGAGIARAPIGDRGRPHGPRLAGRDRGAAASSADGPRDPGGDRARCVRGRPARLDRDA